MTQKNATDDEQTKNVLAALAGQGRVAVEELIGHADGAPFMVWDTTAGTLRINGPVTSSKTEGVDFNRYWDRYGYEINYSIDRNTDNETRTLLVKEA